MDEREATCFPSAPSSGVEWKRVDATTSLVVGLRQVRIAAEGRMSLKNFEARIYNRLVREALRSGRPNDTAFDDSWADTRFVEIKALTRDFALQVAQRRYPADQGFEVEGVEQT